MMKGWNDAPKASLTIRLLIGAYLLYIDYQIFGDVMARTGPSKAVMTVIMVLFAVIGVFLIIMSAKALLGSGGGMNSGDGGGSGQDTAPSETDKENNEKEE